MDSQTFVSNAVPVTIQDKPLFDRYFQQYPQSVCEMTFTNMLLWGESRHHTFLELDGHLITSFQKTGERRMWYPPVGPHPAELIRTQLAPADGFAFLYLPESIADALKNDFDVRETPERFDYIFDLPGLRTLYGALYQKKRNYINRTKKFNPQVERMTVAMGPECEEVIHRWVQESERGNMQSIYDEISAFRLAMLHFDALRMTGVVIRIDGVMQAFALGAPVNDTMFVQHFEKALDTVPGLYPLVSQEIAKAIPEQFTELNKEEDLGMPGLMEAKSSWHPKYMLKKYAIV
jgi:hypothetical protein